MSACWTTERRQLTRFYSILLERWMMAQGFSDGSQAQGTAPQPGQA
jgi:hypothetical protein